MDIFWIGRNFHRRREFHSASRPTLWRPPLSPNNNTMKMKTCIQTLGILAVAASLSYGQDAPKREHKRPDPEAAFKKLDSDNSGSISEAEFLASPRAKKDEAKAKEIFKKLDSDSSGEVSLEEFKAHGHGKADGGKRKGGKKHKKGGAE